MKSAVLTLLALLIASPASAQSIRDYKFLVHEVDADGEIVESSETAFVPLVPYKTCFEWRLRIDEEQDEILQFTEIFKLPEPPAEWTGIEGNPYSRTLVSPDRRSARSEMVVQTEGGWFGHVWCVGEGDPAGDHEIEILAGGRTLHQFFFTMMEAP